MHLEIYPNQMSPTDSAEEPKNIMNTFAKILFLLAPILISFNSYATEYIIEPFNEFNPDIVGKFLRFKPQVLYLVLDNSPPDFLKRNNGINRMVARVEDAEGNDIHEKETIKDNMVFEVISIFKHIDTKPKPADWPDEQWKEYLAWLEANPWMEVEYVLKDENGIVSTTGPGGLTYTYDVTNNRNLIIKSYSSKVPQKMREELIETIKAKGIEKYEDINEALRQTIPILATKNMFAVKELLEPCSEEIRTYCDIIYNGHLLIDCLKDNRKHANPTCKNALTKAIGE